MTPFEPLLAFLAQLAFFGLIFGFIHQARGEKRRSSKLFCAKVNYWHFLCSKRLIEAQNANIWLIKKN